MTGSPHLNDVIGNGGHSGLAGLRDDIRVIRRVRAAKFDTAIDFHGGPRSSLITWLSGAPVRVGYDIRGRSWMYTIRVPRPRHIRPRHAVLNQWDLLGALGIPEPDASRMPAEMAIDPVAAASVAKRLADGGVRPTTASLWCTERRQSLPPLAADRFAVLVSGPRPDAAVASRYPPSDAAAVIEQARARLGTGEARRVLACGEFSLAEFRALVDRAALYIGGDSGPLHIASTSRTPIVGLYGPTLPVRSEPWRSPEWTSAAVEVEGLPCRPCDQRRCEPGDFRCLTWIEPKQVLASAERILARTLNPER